MVLFHHQISTCRENVKCRKEKSFYLLPGTLKVVPQKWPPLLLRIVWPLRMKYTCSSIEI